MSSRTAAKFVVVGLSNTLIGLGAIYALKAFLGLDDAFANFFGYCAALLWSFLLNRSWTFEHRGHEARAFARFIVVVAVAYVVNLLAVLHLVRDLQVNGYIAQALGIVPYSLLFYLGCKLYVFRS